MAVATTSVDCESLCCCRCHKCTGVGYYMQADITFGNYIGTWNMNGSGGDMEYLSGETTWSVAGMILSGATVSLLANPHDPRKYGSEGGNGQCNFSHTSGPYTVTGTISGGGAFEGAYDGDYNLSVELLDYTTLSYATTGAASPFAFRDGGGHHVNTIDCVETGMAVNLVPCASRGSDLVYSQCPTPFSSSFSGATLPNFTAPEFDSISIAWSGDYYQCGQNSDGTPYEEEAPMLMAAVAKAVGPNVNVNLRQPLPLAHPDRCRHLGNRTEWKAGCNGWKCAHECDLNLQAVPGLACQSCEKYESDPDYAGHGPAGWLK